MIKIKNQSVVREVAAITYKANRKRNYLTIFSIILTTFLIVAVFSIGSSYWSTISLRQLRMSGMDYDISLSEPQTSQVSTILAMDNVKRAGLSVKCEIIDSYQEIALGKIPLYWLDQTAWEFQCAPALEKVVGDYPHDLQEIMLSTRALSKMGIKDPQVGMNLTVQSYHLTPDEKYSNVSQTHFVLSGYFTDYSGTAKGFVSEPFYSQTGAKQTDFTQGELLITLKNSLYSEDEILSMQEAINIDKNQFINADYDTISNFIKMILVLLGLLLMILTTGYLFIYNTLYISVSKDIRYFGQLKTLGMTAKQLKGIITRTTIINSAIGTPMGLLFGIGITIGFIPQILLVMDSGLSSNEVSAVPIWAYLIAAVFSFVTNLLSSVKPGKIVAECPPIEAIKYRGKMTANKIKKSERGGLLTMAYRNIWRDKKQAMIILISFVIMGTLFFISNVVIKGNDAKTILNTISENDLEVSNMTTLDENLPLITDKLIGKLTAIDGIKSIGLVSSAEAIVPYQEEIFGEFYRNLYSSRWTPGGDYQEAIEAYKKDPQLYTFTTRFVGIDHTEFLKLNAKLGNTLNESDFKSGKIAVIDNFFGIEMGDVMGKSVNFQIPSGLDPKAQQSISIAAVADGPAYFSGGYTPVINVSLEYAQTLIEQPHLEGINIVYDQPFSEHTEKQINDILAPEKRLSTESKLSRYKEMAPTEQQVKILGGSLAFLIAFLALLNYFSMAAASVQERLKEFAMLESIGMTQNQLKKMLAVEGVSYALLSIAISTIIGIPLSFLVFQSIKVYDIAYAIPWITIVLLYLVITLLCISIPVALFRRSQKDCLMERLRKEI